MVQLARYEEAVESFDRALALKPGDADMLNNRGSALAALGRHEAALASFDQALRLLPESAEVLSNRAISLKGGKARRGARGLRTRSGRISRSCAVVGDARQYPPRHDGV